MKSVLMSINPRPCENIASGIKKYEIRKRCPNLETPFKVYVYCTKDEPLYHSGSKFWCKAAGEFGNGKVIGEFVCDKVKKFIYEPDYETNEMVDIGIGACLSPEEMKKYFKEKSKGFALHISKLKVYEKPRMLSEFFVRRFSNVTFDKVPVPMKRAPQSWCYIEEADNGEDK